MGFGTRLSLFLLTGLAASSANAQTSWIAHYVPVGAPGSTRSNGAAQALAVDASGNVFVVSGGESSGQPQTCVFKLDPQGTQSAQICFASGWIEPSIVAVGPDGNPVIAGTTGTPTSLHLVSPLISQTNSETGFVIKFESDLSGIVFSTLLGGNTSSNVGAGTNVTALALDQTGNIYLSGWTADGNFPVTTGAYQTTAPMNAIPAFVTVISSAGDKILWSTLFGGPQSSCTNCNAGSATVSAIAVDPTGAVVIAGSTGEQIPVTAGVIGPTCTCTNGTTAAFLAKLASAGSQLTWATYVSNVSVSALALDGSDNVILGGQAYTGFTTTTGALQTAFPGGPQTQVDDGSYDLPAGFVAKINLSATQYLFATYLGGNNFNIQRFINSYEMAVGANGVTGLALDAEGTIWVTGGSLTSELPLPSSVPILGTNYVIDLNPDGSSVTNAVTVPEGGAGLGIASSMLGPVVLGKSGSTLIPVSGVTPALAGITNAAGLTASGSVVPNEIISLFGENLGPSTPVSGNIINGVLTTSLGGVQVEFDGVAAPLLYAGPNQINAVVPSGIASQSSTTMNIVTPTGTISGIVLSMAASFPEVFANPGPGNAAYAINQDGTLNSSTNPAAQGSVVSVWATGGGLSGNPEVDGAITGSTVYPVPLAVSVGTGIPGAVSIGPTPVIPAPVVSYSGDAPDLVKGAIQVNFSIPQYPSPFSPGAAEFYLWIGNAVSDPFTVYVQ